MFLLFPRSARGNLTMAQRRATTFTPPIVLFSIFLFITIYIVLNFLICSLLLIPFLSQFVPVLYSKIVFCLPALHVVFLPRCSAGLRPFPLLLFCFRFIYLLFTHCTLFPFVSPTLLTYMLSYVSLHHTT